MSVDEILLRDHSNETSLKVLSHGKICFPAFYKMKFGTFCLVKGLNGRPELIGKLAIPQE